MDAEATILNLRRASACERMARIGARKKEARHVADMIREREAIANEECILVGLFRGWSARRRCRRRMTASGGDAGGGARR